jgi:hypothetical protein
MRLPQSSGTELEAPADRVAGAAAATAGGVPEADSNAYPEMTEGGGSSR